MIQHIQAPRINTNDDQVGVVAWHVEDGAFVEAGADLVDLETSKAVVTIECEHRGYLRRRAAKGEIVRVGATLCDVADAPEDFAHAGAVDAAAPAPTSAAEPRAVSTAATVAPSAPTATRLPLAAPVFDATRISPSAMQLMTAHGLRPEDFSGVGLVTAKIVRERISPTPPIARAPQASQSAVGRTATLLPRQGPIVPREESVSLAKRAEIEQLSTGESGLINSTLSMRFESEPVRARLRAEGRLDGNIQPIILFELSRLLLQWPQFTAYFENDQVHYYDRIDIGVAVDLGKGLKVARIKDADTLNPVELFERTIDFGLRYLDNKLRPDELVGSTITVTDLSSLDIVFFKPLINGRQSAILGIGGDSSQRGYPMSFNLTFDHRVTNGREAATFLKELRARVLSYAGAGATESHDTQGSTVPASAPTARIPVRCENCGIDNDSYVQEFGSDARMLACLNGDGSMVAVCHRCYAGWL
jgi:pyruvate/2-oxoglutarate dehydrogenase complex dihydrolipoamide acyltransferase (E2) component